MVGPGVASQTLVRSLHDLPPRANRLTQPCARCRCSRAWLASVYGEAKERLRKKLTAFSRISLAASSVSGPSYQGCQISIVLLTNSRLHRARPPVSASPWEALAWKASVASCASDEEHLEAAEKSTPCRRPAAAARPLCWSRRHPRGRRPVPALGAARWRDPRRSAESTAWPPEGAVSAPSGASGAILLAGD